MRQLAYCLITSFTAASIFIQYVRQKSNEQILIYAVRHRRVLTHLELFVKVGDGMKG